MMKVLQMSLVDLGKLPVVWPVMLRLTTCFQTHKQAASQCAISILHVITNEPKIEICPRSALLDYDTLVCVMNHTCSHY